jgi:sec-independent protein translocase protein TatC
MPQADSQYDPEDMFADTRMSFGDHLEELRMRLWRALAGFLVAMLLCFFISKPVLSVFIIRPVELQLQQYYDDLQKRQTEEALGDKEALRARHLNDPKVVTMQFLRKQWADLQAGKAVQLVEEPEKLPADEWVPIQIRIPDPVGYLAEFQEAEKPFRQRVTMKTFGITEAFMVYFKISLACGLVLGSPWIFYQIWAFVAAGLYPREKRYVHIYLPFSVVLFWIGVFVCQFVVLPRVISALLWFNSWLNVDPDLRLNEWLGFAILFPVIFGLSFQTPLVMLFLERLGIFTVETYRSKRKIAFFIMCVVAAFGPTVDAYSMIFQMLALWLLYQLGIWLCMWMPRSQETEVDMPESEEMVEV